MPDLGPVYLTIRLASVTTLILILLATPFAYWLSRTKSRAKPALEALCAMPLVLPPTVLGFYLLILMSPDSLPGQLWLRATGDTLTFSFSGLVIASVLYTLPFAVQPLQTAFEETGPHLAMTARNLGAGPLDAFATISVPLAARGFLTAGVLSFAHTVGEFGVVLMVGGNIPGRTKVISIDIYGKVEMLNYREAHLLAGGMVAFSFLVLFVVFLVNRRAFRAG